MSPRTTAGQSIAVLTVLLAACTTPSFGDAVPTDRPRLDTHAGASDGGDTPAVPDGPKHTASGDLIVDGDILFPGAFVKTVADAAAFNVQRWPDATVPYEIAPDLPNPERIAEAANHWAMLTGIRFVQRNSEPNYVRFVSGEASRSYLGIIGAQQEITLRPDTTDHPTEVIHVLGHVLGFAHQHSRADRDGFITIVEENIEPGHQIDFDKSNLNPLGDYDVGSVMQLGSDLFSKNGKPTMTTKTGDVIAAATTLSAKDVTTARTFYAAQLPTGTGGTPSTDPSITVSWPVKSNTATYSLDAQLSDGTWVAPCIGSELLKRSLWTKFDGNCPSSKASPGPFPLTGVKAFRICSAENENWASASCQTKPYAQEKSLRIAP